MNKKLILIMLLTIFVSSLIMTGCDDDTVSKKSNDAGTPGTVVEQACSKVVAEEISSPEALVAIGANDANLAKSYKLTKDIDLAGEEWQPLGDNKTHPFTGSFHGCGFAIKNLKIDKQSHDVGLFAKIGRVGSIATISNLTIVVHVDGIKGKDYTGALAGGSITAKITNVNVSGGPITGEDSVGGLIGTADNDSIIENSYATVNVSGDNYVGGLIGILRNSTLRASYATTGTVNGTTGNLGGLVGRADNNSIIENSYATVNVSGNYYVGGLIGILNNSTLRTSYTTTGTINGETDIGGLVGRAENGNIAISYATVNVSGDKYVGGLIGVLNKSMLTDSYATTGTVNGTGQDLGGLVGIAEDNSTIENSYATGKVTGKANVGGLLGRYSGTTTITNSYFDTETTGRKEGVGLSPRARGIPASATGLTKEDITATAVFVGWRFNTIWNFTINQWPTLINNPPTP